MAALNPLEKMKPVRKSYGWMSVVLLLQPVVKLRLQRQHLQKLVPFLSTPVEHQEKRGASLKRDTTLIGLTGSLREMAEDFDKRRRI